MFNCCILLNYSDEIPFKMLFLMFFFVEFISQSTSSEEDPCGELLVVF